MDREDLIRWVGEGRPIEWLFFWGHTPIVKGQVDSSCLSQWYSSPFEVDGVRYLTAEHFMMAEKARCFGDNEALTKVLQTTSPAEAKKVGRSVEGYRESTWADLRFQAVVQGNLFKFGSSKPLRYFLLGTGKKILVEASPYDAIWGIGLSKDNPLSRDPSRWKGHNYLGFALMEVRRTLLKGYWLEAIYALVECGQNEDALDILYERIDGLLSKGAMREVDSILGGIDLDRLDVTLLLATLTVTLSASPYLTCRPNLVRGVEGRIRELAPDRVECLMAGLR